MRSNPSRTRVLLLSLLAAAVIWLFNELNKEGYTLQVRYPIQLTYNDSVYVPLTPLPKSVTATLIGNGWALLRKTLSFTVAPVAFEIANPLVTRTLDASMLSSVMSQQVRDVQIRNVAADTNMIDFDERQIKTCVLMADSTDIDLAPNFVISSLINLTPRTVTFDGPSLLVNDIADTIRVKVPAKKIRGNYDEELRIPYPQSMLVKPSVEKVFVSFEVAELLRKVPSKADTKAAK
jgi:hypothetical protein